MAGPIQIILNTEDFEQKRDVGGGGPRRDFFAHRDAEFRAHKRMLITQLATVGAIIRDQPQGPMGVIKVILRRDAWAKSHRPFRALFKPERITLVGGGDLGELYFEATLPVLEAIAREIARAEEFTRTKLDEKTGRQVPHPTSLKSETGAVERIELYGPEDRRDFSVEAAVTWLSNPVTGSSYQVELFEVPPPHETWDAKGEARRQLYRTFIEGLTAIGQGLSVYRLPRGEHEDPQIAVRVAQTAAPAMVQLARPQQVDRRRGRELAPFDADMSRHRRLLSFLDKHPLVRRVELPPIITRTTVGGRLGRQESAGPTAGRPNNVTLPTRDARRTYPKMGIIDGGVGDALADWIIGRWDVLSDEHIDADHGSFIGGLAVAGSLLNPNVCPEPDGTEIVDLAVLPDTNANGAFPSYYPDGIEQFFQEIDYAVADAKAQHNVRVFNMSLNVQLPATPTRYGSFAKQLDDIATTHNAIFFISAGNIAPQNLRPEWPADETQALVGLANARNDGILMPAESTRNVSIAALNPPGLPNVIPFAPARYSRRGPGLRAGVKPDLAHIGGSGSPHGRLGHGLYSITPNGAIVDGCGTSYASPLVAKTAAVLEHSIEGEVSRETLTGLLLHHARMPDVLAGKRLSAVARDLAGFGVPPSADEILNGGDHQITLVFATRIRPDQEISFRFAWPTSLVTPEGKCRGAARLTLVSTPPLDTRFGSEFVRVNIDAALQQEEVDGDGVPHWRGRLDPVYLPGAAERRTMEAERIEHGLKWSPVKVFSKTMPIGVGRSSNWRLFVEYLTRAGERMPIDGVPFTALLTISDPRKEAPVFNDMRLSLNALGARIEDIRTAARVAART
ncbi:S8 family peptidase [Methylobacterium sp. yr668]|uniref:S8 family peptidase n=1 Tax=Methylobacterium sp. yr668 TaxID=1761801 RepID=UPI0008E80A9C|nr:S8 family peptidase [Methylobacterium sp. yr668]SFT26587.1 Subtilase family protein [Methylobacterium sp. yr668]